MDTELMIVGQIMPTHKFVSAGIQAQAEALGFVAGEEDADPSGMVKMTAPERHQYAHRKIPDDEINVMREIAKHVRTRQSEYEAKEFASRKDEAIKAAEDEATREMIRNTWSPGAQRFIYAADAMEQEWPGAKLPRALIDVSAACGECIEHRACPKCHQPVCACFSDRPAPRSGLYPSFPPKCVKHVLVVDGVLFTVERVRVADACAQRFISPDVAMIAGNLLGNQKRVKIRHKEENEISGPIVYTAPEVERMLIDRGELYALALRVSQAIATGYIGHGRGELRPYTGSITELALSLHMKTDERSLDMLRESLIVGARTEMSYTSLITGKTGTAYGLFSWLVGVECRSKHVEIGINPYVFVTSRMPRTEYIPVSFWARPIVRSNRTARVDAIAPELVVAHIRMNKARVRDYARLGGVSPETEKGSVIYEALKPTERFRTARDMEKLVKLWMGEVCESNANGTIAFCGPFQAHHDSLVDMGGKSAERGESAKKRAIVTAKKKAKLGRG